MKLTKTEQAISNAKNIPEYQKYFAQEYDLIKKYVFGETLDVGCGQCRVLPYINNQIKKYIGFDHDKKMLDNMKIKLSEKYNNVQLICGDANELSKYFSNFVDSTICLWNTLSVMGNEIHLLEEMKKVTKGPIIITLAAKNKKTLEVRTKYYQTMGLEHHIDETTHSITSEAWGVSKAYKIEDMKTLAKKSGLKVSECDLLGELGIYAILMR